MEKTFQVVVFGKNGCPKCKVLNNRVDSLLQEEDWKDFEKTYMSLDTEEGLVAFSKAECINPQRVPALVIARRDEDGGRFRYLARLCPGGGPEDCDGSSLYHLLGLQTDYSEKGRGVISPKMIRAVLEEARRA